MDAADLYRHYYYATPQSTSLTDHYFKLAARAVDLGLLSPSSRVLEIGSNVGAFLEFLRPNVADVLGVDPARNIAEIANARGVRTIPEFFGVDVAQAIVEQLGPRDVVVSRHCMAHNRDPYIILEGVERVLSDDGVFVLENAYALNTLLGGEFDQIYHEHMFFFTLHSIVNILSRAGLTVVDVMFSSVHGGSIACFAKRRGAGFERSVEEALERERSQITSDAISTFARRALITRDALRKVITDALAERKKIYAYGATAKGATLMNYCGFSAAQIPYSADSTPMKQGRFFPKSGIEIVSEEWAYANPPDAFLLTAWNYRDEIVAKARRAGLQSAFVVPIPSVEIIRSS